MFQVGLLGFIREDNLQAGLKLMLRALVRLDGLFSDKPAGRLCWIGAAAVESQLEGQLLPRKARKQLFSRLDREIKQALVANGSYEAPRSLLKELLYLVALADSRGPQSSAVREVFGLTPLPFTDHLLDEEYQRLSGPGQGVMRSLSTAIREELASVKDLLDLIERGTAQPDSFGNLHALLGKLSKTLNMVGLSSAANALQVQLPVVGSWSEESLPANPDLHKLAEAVLYVESMVASLERGEQRNARPQQAQPGDDGLGRRAAGYGLHAADEAAFLDDEFAADRGGECFWHVRKFATAAPRNRSPCAAAAPGRVEPSYRVVADREKRVSPVPVPARHDCVHSAWPHRAPHPRA